MTEEEPQVMEITSHDNHRFHKAKLTWRIIDFEKRMAFTQAAGTKTLLSDTFKVNIPIEEQDSKELHFCLKIFWNHKSEETRNDEDDDKWKNIGMYLNFLSNSSTAAETTLAFTFSALLNDGKAWGKRTSGPRTFSEQNRTWGWNGLFSKELIAQTRKLFDKDKSLTMVCDLDIMCNRDVKSMTKAPIYQPFCLGEELCMATETKDVTLICTYKDEPKSKKRRRKEIIHDMENTIKCHKLILTTRSDVFKAMFSHDQTSESQTNTVTIEDTPKDLLQEFVDYLYTDKSESLLTGNIENIGNMLMLADKYNVLSLKQRSEDRLLELIEGSTVQNIYALAYLYNCEPVQKAIASYVESNFDDAFNSGLMANFTQDMQNKIMKDVCALKLKAAKK